MTLASDSPTEPVAQGSVGAAVLQRNLEAHLFGNADPVQLDRFVILETLGKGGMGSVYAAYDPDLDRKVAIKVLHTLGARSRQGMERLQREAKVLARLSHPSVVRVHEVGMDDDRLFIAMEFAPGGTLAEWAEALEPGPARRSAIVERIRECIAGLQAAHDAGLIHRDFKPANVLLGADGRAKVADFGLATADELAIDAIDPDAPVGEERITNTAQLVGTPAYMAPEQLEGQADPRSDQFSLCVTFFELLYGVRPFPGDTIASLAANIHDGNIVWPRDRSLSWARPIFERGLHREPARRFPNLRALDDAIRRSTRSRSGTRRTLAIAGITGGVLAIAWPRAEQTTPAVGEPCTDGSETLAGVWDESSQTAIRNAFEATGQPAWPGLWERVQRRFDRWSEQWRAMTLDSCEATRIHRTQDERTYELRRLCLARQRERARRLSESYLAVNGETVYDTTRTSLELPQVTQCEERGSLSFAGGLDLSSPQVQEFYRLFDEGDLAGLQHRNGVAELMLRDAALVAQQADIPKLAALALRGVSLMLSRGGEHDEAKVFAQAALTQAERAGDPDDVVSGWHQLGHVAHVAHKEEDAAFYLARALTIADGFNATSEARVAALATAAHVEHRKGDPARAAQMLLDAAEQSERLGLRPTRTLAYLQDAAGPLSLSGQQEQALEIGRRAVQMSIDLRGEMHPDTLNAQVSLAQQHLVIGQPELALPLTTQVVANLPPLGSTLPSRRIDMRAFHGDILHENGRTKEGLEVLLETIAEAEQTLGADAMPTLNARGNYAKVASESGDYEGAIAALDRIIEAYEGKQGVMLIRKAGAYLNRAEAKSKLGQHPGAVADLETALPMLRESTGPQSVWRFDSDVMAGEIFAAAGKPDRALAHFEAAEAIAADKEVSPEGRETLEAGLAALRPKRSR